MRRGAEGTYGAEEAECPHGCHPTQYAAPKAYTFNDATRAASNDSALVPAVRNMAHLSISAWETSGPLRRPQLRQSGRSYFLYRAFTMAMTPDVSLVAGRALGTANTRLLRIVGGPIGAYCRRSASFQSANALSGRIV